MATSTYSSMLNRVVGYPYTNLETPRSFRLLRFLGTGDASDDIYCTIETFDKDKPNFPSYVALSYAWGDANITKSITLDGHVTLITKNLHEALFHLRRIRTTLWFWIDAICVNQEDLTERCHQVSRMKEIYSEQAKIYRG
ncbi:heterokaryon incompatibility protein-domain-containing protein [Phaeosphaeriaceae sp. PMI808]|nr:heterokaryon incompatibility protein-domain-containing protein [Phaeosphaeriaceae sp. PMI808]